MLDIASIEIFVNLPFSEILKFTVNDGNYKYILSILLDLNLELDVKRLKLCMYEAKHMSLLNYIYTIYVCIY